MLQYFSVIICITAIHKNNTVQQQIYKYSEVKFENIFMFSVATNQLYTKRIQFPLVMADPDKLEIG